MAVYKISNFRVIFDVIVEAYRVFFVGFGQPPAVDQYKICISGCSQVVGVTGDSQVVDDTKDSRMTKNTSSPATILNNLVFLWVRIDNELDRRRTNILPAVPRRQTAPCTSHIEYHPEEAFHDVLDHRPVHEDEHPLLVLDHGVVEDESEALYLGD